MPPSGGVVGAYTALTAAKHLFNSAKPLTNQKTDAHAAGAPGDARFCCV
jgi:hypothetical protein